MLEDVFSDSSPAGAGDRDELKKLLAKTKAAHLAVKKDLSAAMAGRDAALQQVEQGSFADE